MGLERTGGPKPFPSPVNSHRAQWLVLLWPICLSIAVPVTSSYSYADCYREPCSCAYMYSHVTKSITRWCPVVGCDFRWHSTAAGGVWIACMVLRLRIQDRSNFVTEKLRERSCSCQNLYTLFGLLIRMVDITENHCQLNAELHYAEIYVHEMFYVICAVIGSAALNTYRSTWVRP